MKIIGSQGNGVFIATVTRHEIEKLHDKYYSKQTLPDTKVGDEYDLAAGYDFRAEIRQSCKEMTDAMTRFKRAQDAMTRFAAMVADMPEPGVTLEQWIGTGTTPYFALKHKC